MTGMTRRLRELIASGEFLYMPSAATPLEGRLAEAMGAPLVYTGGYVSGASRAITEPLLTMDEQVRMAGEEMGYRACIDAQILLAVAVHAMRGALGELMQTGSYTSLSDADFVALRQEIEDLIGLDAYYRIEAATVEPQSRPG